MYDINIIIVNWLMKDDTERCLVSLFSDLQDSSLKTIVHVIDNSGNRDGIKEMLAEKFPQVVYRDSGGNIGFGRAQNLGCLMAVSEYYITLNPDIEFIPGNHTLAKLIEYMRTNPKVGLVGPQLLNRDGSSQSSCRRFPRFFQPIAHRLKMDEKLPFCRKYVENYTMADYTRDKTVPVDWIIGGFMLIRREVTDKIGFFDDRYFAYFEDCDYCRQVWAAGWQVHYLSDIKVYHLHRRQSAQMPAWKALFLNPVARIHIRSWLKYFAKWGIMVKHYGV